MIYEIHAQIGYRSYLVKSNAREEIINKREEEGLVFINQLRQVHVPQHPHHNTGNFKVVNYAQV